MQGNEREFYRNTQRQYPKVSDTRTGNYYIPGITELEDDPVAPQQPPPPKKPQIAKLVVGLAVVKV